MNRVIAESHKIQPHHLERAAYVYVRQSSLRQVTEHLESRRRQYERVDWAMASGWPRERIEVGAASKAAIQQVKVLPCQLLVSDT